MMTRQIYKKHTTGMYACGRRPSNEFGSLDTERSIAMISNAGYHTQVMKSATMHVRTNTPRFTTPCPAVSPLCRQPDENEEQGEKKCLSDYKMTCPTTVSDATSRHDNAEAARQRPIT